MMRQIAVLNAGSSSVKFAFVAAEGLGVLAHGLVELRDGAGHLRVSEAAGRVLAEAEWAGGTAFHAEAVERILDWHAAAWPGAEVVACGHRVVHGGPDFAAPVAVDAEVMRALAGLVPLAPLHQPHNLAGLTAAASAWPGAVQVACFDTAFHRAHPWEADAFALPRALYAQGVRRYGFHGLSYEYVTGRLAELAPAEAAGRVIVAHLGNGASMCAIAAGKSVASTMGFTALDGLPMGTRCGQLDPGVVLWLIETQGMSTAEVTQMLYARSGLLGMSGLSGDMRTLLASDSAEAAQAVRYYVARIRREIGGLSAAMGGLDTLVFCGGIGEHAVAVRAAVLEGMGWFGITPDPAANRAGAGVISAPGSAVTVRVITTDEEAMIARHTAAVLRQIPRCQNPQS